MTGPDKVEKRGSEGSKTTYKPLSDHTPYDLREITGGVLIQGPTDKRWEIRGRDAAFFVDMGISEEGKIKTLCFELPLGRINVQDADLVAVGSVNQDVLQFVHPATKKLGRHNEPYLQWNVETFYIGDLRNTKVDRTVSYESENSPFLSPEGRAAANLGEQVKIRESSQVFPKTLEAVHSELIEYHKEKIRQQDSAKSTPLRNGVEIDKQQASEIRLELGEAGLAGLFDGDDPVGFWERAPIFAFINFEDFDSRYGESRTIELGFVYNGDGESGVNTYVGIELNLDIKPGIVETYSAKDVPNHKPERNYSGKERQLSPEQLQVINSLLHTYSPLPA
ncbi:MAG: hypothetical protein V1697_03410 [Candidatus Levyibacteriota bacterium]